MVDACTGVILVNPMLAVASRIHSDIDGVRALHALDEADFSLVSPLSGAMSWKKVERSGRFYILVV